MQIQSGPTVPLTAFLGCLVKNKNKFKGLLLIFSSVHYNVFPRRLLEQFSGLQAAFGIIWRHRQLSVCLNKIFEEGF
jgi:hypothetical protein